MNYLKEPRIYFEGSEYCESGYLKKICIDYSKKIIRGSMEVKINHNNPNIKKQKQFQVGWFDFDNPLIRIEGL